MSGVRGEDVLVGLGLLVVFVALFVWRTHRGQRSSVPSMLLGPIDRAKLEAFPGFSPASVAGFEPDPAAIGAIATLSKGLSVLAFVGTWCPDSVRQVPRFLYILDRAGLEAEQCSFIGLDRSKRDEAGLAEQYAVQSVPTFVVMRGGRELGRITERPVDSLERDLANILAGIDS